jgi:undecaprenyldiphospho-muramoylpentapeptide beta-N-acetylglucosaminyltransferase
LLICAGGTGGGVYPALAVLQELSSKIDSIVWVGGEKGMEADLVQSSPDFASGRISFMTIPAAGVHGVGLKAFPGNSLRLIRGYFASRRILHQQCPDALLFTGGYLAIPMALAARQIPSLAYVPDIEPGLALKTLAHLSTRIAVTTNESRSYFSRKAHLVVTGYPTRRELAHWSPSEARLSLGLKVDQPVLLVTGGSKGARSINQALIPALPALLQELQVIHITGQLDWKTVQEAQANLPQGVKDQYHPFPYLNDIGAALASASLVLSRAGASVLGEYPQFSLPAILVPYPYAWRYQHVNAEYLANRGAATIIEDAQLARLLVPVVTDIINNASRMEAMRTAMHSLYRPQAAQDLAASIIELGNLSFRRRR